MRIPVILVLLFLFLSSLPGFATTREYREIIVKFAPAVTVSQAPGTGVVTNRRSVSVLLSKYEVNRAEPVFSEQAQVLPEALKNCLVLTSENKTSLPALIEALSNNPEVIWAEANHAYKIDFTPNDSLFQQQWALQKIRTESAWNIEQGSADVLVGVIDTGVDYLHQDLRGQIWVNTIEDLNHNGRLDSTDVNGIDDDGNGYVDDVIGWDFTDAPNFPDGGDYLDPDNDPMDEFAGGHGTAVGGIIAAATDNVTGVAGIAPGARIMPLRAGTAAGFLEEDDIAEAIVYGVQNGCRIINMSFGDVVYSHLIKDAVMYGSSQGVLFVSSAGNSGNSTLQYPAGYDETISVGATDENDNLAPFSSYGSKINLVAPGQEVLALSTGNDYSRLNGTSFSAPMVSGALALICSHYPTASSQAVTARLYSACRDLGTRGWDQYYGHGLLNVFGSLTDQQQTLAQIDQPQTSGGVKDDSVAIIGSAVGSDMREYSLAYGAGEMPLRLTTFFTSRDHVLNDTLGFWHTAALPDSVYTLELKIENQDFRTFVSRVIVYLDRTAPVLDSLNILPMVIDNFYGDMIQIFTDDQTVATLLYRQVGETDFTRSLASGYFSDRHFFLLSQQDIQGQIEFYIRLENSSGLITRVDNEGQYYTIDLTQPNTFTADFHLVAEETGFGYFLNRSADLNGDGTVDLVAQAVWPDKPEARLNIINFQNGQFVRHISSTPAFPRDFRDVDADGKPEILAGFGGSSFLFPGSGLPEFSVPPVQSALADFWGARLFDFFNDGQKEILTLNQNQWHLFRLDRLSDFSVSLMQTLDNPTAGENNYGVPYAEIADLDGDLNPEIILGDYDGDLLLYERNQNNEYLPVFTKRLPGVDATHRFACGDFDGDGVKEIAVATQQLAEYLGESAIDRQYWILTVLKSEGDNSLKILWQQNFYGLVDQKGAFTGVSSQDYDGDGRDEIFFTPYPKAYFIQYENNSYQLNWFYRGANSNAVPQIEPRRFLLSSDSTLMVWEIQPTGQKPLPPARLWVEAADSEKIVLNWEKPGAGVRYQVNRIRHNGSVPHLFLVGEPPFVDSTVTTGELYRYRVKTIDSSFANPVSNSSEPVEVRAENPPVFEALEQTGRAQVLLRFSAPLGGKSFQVNQYWLLSDSLRPLSAVRGKGKQQVLLTFNRSFSPGKHAILLYDLENEHRVPFYRDSLLIPFTAIETFEQLYLQKVEMISKRRLRLVFNHPMDENSVVNTAHYQLIPQGKILSVEPDTLDASIVYLNLEGKNRMGSLGEKYYLEASGLQDKWGNILSREFGNRFLIQRQVTDLESITVFPNPFRPSGQKNQITFGNIPNGTEIFIYTAGGKNVTRLRESDNDGGVKWDLRNREGKPVGSGVYIFLARFSEQQKLGKFAIIK